ncbi:MAG: formylglycine-generating enzyme family protein [Deinococcales bacterium]
MWEPCPKMLWGASSQGGIPAVAWQTVTRNAGWTPMVQEFNGTRMVLVPVGSFNMGSEQYDSEKPVHRQEIKAPYWLDETEVTREAYESCVRAGACSSTPANNYSTSGNQPINSVTWPQAKGYCEWRGARLPTEVEWEYAARGPDDLTYPWGNTYDASKANGGDSGEGKTKAVRSYDGGKSWVGAYDLSGNVWEWLSTKYQSYPYLSSDGREQDIESDMRVLRGGSFDNSADFLRAAGRVRFDPAWFIDDIGFRCARSV